MKKALVASLILLIFSIGFIRTAFADSTLLPSPGWHLSGNNGDSQMYHNIPSNSLIGMTTMTITYDLHGYAFKSYGWDASAIIIDQNGQWRYIALKDYGVDGRNGQQTVNIPLSAFTGLNLTQPVGTLHTRFWHSGSWQVDIYSISVSGPVTPTPTPTISATPTISPTSGPTPTGIPNPNRPDHTVVVVEENQTFQNVLRTGYFTTLANQGALMVNSKSLTHPSQASYFQLFSGSTQGIIDDTCPPPGSPYSTNNLGNQLLTNAMSFKGYAENQPTTNARTNCSVNTPWDNNHVPWLHFSNIPSGSQLNYTSFPTDYSTLPTVSFVIPNKDHDAHDGTIQQAADWLQTNIEPYRAWAMTNNSLLIVTFDEDDDTADNTIYTVFTGPMIKKGIYNNQINHYNVLSTIEDLYGLPHLNTASGITNIFN